MSSNAPAREAADLHGAGAALAAADAAEAEGRRLDAIDALQAANRDQPDPRIESRLVALRHEAFGEVRGRPGRDSWPPSYPDRWPELVGVPAIEAPELTSDTLGSAVVNHGALIVRDLVPPAWVDRMTVDIDQVFEASGALVAGTATRAEVASWYAPFKPTGTYAGRTMPRRYVRDAGGVWAVDSPRGLFDLVELFDEIGVTSAIAGYFAERPVLAMYKWALRRVPADCGNGWHQDGAFLGEGLRTIDVWIALSTCGGDADCPGLDIVPRRFDDLLETGTPGAPFETFLAPDIVERDAGVAPVRPVFQPGDAIFFDDLFVHQTGVDPGMTRERYALESWFFAPSTFPDEQIPFVV